MPFKDYLALTIGALLMVLGTSTASSHPSFPRILEGNDDYGVSHGAMRGSHPDQRSIRNDLVSRRRLSYVVSKHHQTLDSAPDIALASLSPSYHMRRTLVKIGDWEQMGEDIKSKYDIFSMTMSRDGKRIAISHWVSPSSIIRVYELVGSTWKQFGYDIDGTGYEKLSLSDKGTHLAISRNEEVVVVRWNGSAWVQMGQTITHIDPGEGNERYFRDVAISDDGQTLVTAAEGGYIEDCYEDGCWYQRKLYHEVRAFKWDGSEWQQSWRFGQEHGVRDILYFGSAISLSGNGKRLAVSRHVRANDTGGPSVRIYEDHGSRWYELGADSSDEEKQRFGNSGAEMSRDGNRIVTGDSSGNVYARVMEWNGTSWIQLGEDIAGPKGLNTYPTVSVAMSSDGERIGVGFSNRTCRCFTQWNISTGMFEWDGTSWKQMGSTKVNENEANSLTLSMSGRGDRIAMDVRKHLGVFEFVKGQTPIGEVLKVDIDVKPLKKSNKIKVHKNRINDKIHVGIVGSEKLNVSEVERDTVEFGEASPIGRRFKNFNGDPYVDLVLKFLKHETKLSSGKNVRVCLYGKTTRGMKFKGCQRVDVVLT